MPIFLFFPYLAVPFAMALVCDHGPPTCVRLAPAGRAWVFVVLMVSAAAAGCSTPRYVSIREVPDSPLVERFQLKSPDGPRATTRTTQLLRRMNLADSLAENPALVLEKLSEAAQQEPNPESYYAISEVSFLAAKKVEVQDEGAALDLYGASVAHAYMFLFDPRVGYLRNPYDPQFRGACDLYNGALESALRILAKRDALGPGKGIEVEAAGQIWQVDVVGRGRKWDLEDFDEFEFASDYQVEGLTNQYRTFGLGVPLVAVRGNHPEQGPEEEYYPAGMTLPMTAFLSVAPDHGRHAAGEAVRHRCVLELYDPLSTTDVTVAGRRVPLESDLSTPLAYFLDRGEVQDFSLEGLLNPDQIAMVSGLYMSQPYEPGKIPVLMVHGLYSSPITWMEMFNDLRSLPEIRENYQFWFYLYPSGQPFWISAAQLRAELMQMRQALDPHRRVPALDQMVVVGHSMGGLVGKMQTVFSRDDYWHLVSDQPFTEIKTDDDTRDTLKIAFFFEPNVSIRRLIMIGTPHRGSALANDATRWLGRKLISLPQMMIARQQALYRENPDLIRKPSLLDVTTSIDSLAPDSPILPVLLANERPPNVKYHSIIGVVEEEGVLNKWTGVGDGVVTYASAHLDDVESELVVNAEHMNVHRHPLAVLEVRRILLEHLHELRTFPRVEPPRIYSVRGNPQRRGAIQQQAR